MNIVKRTFYLKSRSIDSDSRLLSSSIIFGLIARFIKKDRHIDLMLTAKQYLDRHSNGTNWNNNIFDEEYYVKSLCSANMRLDDQDPLIHYITKGWRKNISPNFLIDIRFYKSQLKTQGIKLEKEPLQHYIQEGFKKDLSLCRYFVNDWYRNQYNINENDCPSFVHFLLSGSDLESDPSAFFSMRYLKQVGLHNVSTIDALKQYEDKHMSNMAFRPHVLFDEVFYLEHYSDLRISNMTPLAHYTQYGFKEGRFSIDLNEKKADPISKNDIEQFKFYQSSDCADKISMTNNYTELEMLRLECMAAKLTTYKRPLAIITCYNDLDCIESIIRAAIREELSIWIIDNWSTDGTWEKLKSLQICTDLEPYIESIERYPINGPDKHYDWSGMLQRKAIVAEQFAGRWILHQDSDEISVSIFPNISAGCQLNAIGRMGYNAVNMRMFDFRPIDSSEPILEIEKHFQYFEFSTQPAYGIQIKAWIQGTDRVNLSNTGGHEAQFDQRKIYPLRMPRKHYAIRSVAHGRRKVLQERKSRFTKERETLGWHTHYDTMYNEENFIWSIKEMIRYVPTGHVGIWFDMLFHEDH